MIIRYLKIFSLLITITLSHSSCEDSPEDSKKNLKTKKKLSGAECRKKAAESLQVYINEIDRTKQNCRDNYKLESAFNKISSVLNMVKEGITRGEQINKSELKDLLQSVHINLEQCKEVYKLSRNDLDSLNKAKNKFIEDLDKL